MKDYTITYDKNHYPDLLIKCAHDTNHDFFENPDPMKVEIQRGSGDPMEEDSQPLTQPDEPGEPYDNLTSSGESSEEEDEKTRTVVKPPTESNKRTRETEETEDSEERDIKKRKETEIEPESLLRDIDIPITDFDDKTEYKTDELLLGVQEWAYYIDLDNDIYSYVSADKMTDKTGVVFSRFQRNTDDIESIILSNREAKKLGKEEIIPKENQFLQELHEERIRRMNEQGGGSLGRRKRPLNAVIKKRIETYQTSLKTIFKKVQTWDVFGISINKPEYSSEERDKYATLNEVNSSDTVKSSEKIRTFYEWFTTEQMYSSRSSKIPIILNDIVSLINQYKQEGEIDLRMIHFTFHTLINQYLDAEATDQQMETELEKLFLIVKNFSKYTSIPSDVMSEHLTVKINIESFIKKKWNKYRDNFTRLEAFFGRGKKATLSDDDKEQIVQFKNTVMKGWLTCLDIQKGALQADWAKNEFDRITGDQTITDAKIRDEFLQGEFGINKRQRDGFYSLNRDMSEGTRRVDVESKLLSVSEVAFEKKSFGNNATSTKFYSDDGDKRRYPKLLKGPIMKHTMDYNCNGPNVADPASCCSELESYRDTDVRITLTAGRNSIVYELYGAKQKKDLTKCKMSYEIKYGDKTLKKDNHPVNTLNSKGKKVEGLSKSSVISLVFFRMREILDDQSSSNSEILRKYNLLADKDIQSIVEIFCLKLFGDFGQELYAMALLEDEQEIVYIGNDWISYDRAILGIKYMTNRPNKAWYCGFLGNSSFNIVFPEGVLTGTMGGTSKKQRTRRRSIRKRRTRRRRSKKRRSRKRRSRLTERKKSRKRSTKRRSRKRSKRIKRLTKRFTKRFNKRR